MMKMIDKLDWKYRRRYLVWVTFFTMAMMAYVVGFRAETSIARIVVEMGFGALIAFVGMYVFGAVWDHFNKRKYNARISVDASEVAAGGDKPGGRDPAQP